MWYVRPLPGATLSPNLNFVVLWYLLRLQSVPLSAGVPQDLSSPSLSLDENWDPHVQSTPLGQATAV